MASQSSECSSLGEKAAIMATYPLHNDMSCLDIPLRSNNYPETHAFQEELDGWHGYVEWENYPEKKKLAQEILARYTFAEVCTASLLPFGHC